MKLQVAATPEEAAAAAARLIASLLAVAIRRRGEASLALSGGRTPRPLYEALAAQNCDWRNVHVFQADERVAPAGDPGRNLGALHDILVGRGPLPPERLHPWPVDEAAPDEAAALGEERLRVLCGNPAVLDVVHLGLGDDGHTASLFAGDEALCATAHDVVATAEHGGFRRITLTLPAINRARSIVWFVGGAAKAEVLAELLAGGAPFPAARVSRRRAVVVADASAAPRPAGA